MQGESGAVRPGLQMIAINAHGCLEQTQLRRSPNPSQVSGDDSDSDYEDAKETEEIKTDTQCALCDNGGEILLCDGACMRGFHYGPDENGDICNDLELPEDLVVKLTSSNDPFMCPNCLAGRHQCFICKEEGTADVEVVRCMMASCGKYYHLNCLKKAKAEIQGDGAFICPHHTCHKCNQRVNKAADELVGCRRCPVAYHRGCMPDTILETDEQRVWYADFDDEGSLLPGCEVERSLMYCPKHKMSDGVALHSKDLFSDELLGGFKLYYAEMYPQLESSREILAEAGDHHDDHDAVYEGAVGSPRGQAGGEAFNRNIPVKKVSPDECIPAIMTLFNEAKLKVSKEQIRERTRKPYPFQKTPKPIEDSRLSYLERSFNFANNKYQQGMSGWQQIIDKKTTQDINLHHGEAMMALNPFLHGDRYSSYGRHFTSQRLLRAVVDRLMRFVRSGDRVVDFSCGANEWVPLMRLKALDEGVVLLGKSYDIVMAKDDTDFILKDWFQTTADSEKLGHSDQLVIGLNPPFGKDNGMAHAFVDHAVLHFRPRVIALIVPPATKVPNGYKVVFEDGSMCRGQEFYVPGSIHKSWNKTPPVFRIMVRHDTMPNFYDDPKEWEAVPMGPQ